MQGCRSIGYSGGMDTLPEHPTPDEFASFVQRRAALATIAGRRPAVVFDRDGTLASVEWVRPTEGPDGRTRGWDRFNLGLPFDAVVPYVADLLAAVPHNVHRFMFSGRAAGDRKGETFRRDLMEGWLAKHALPIDTLLMRPGGDQRRDSIIKNEFADAVAADGFEIVAAVDDRPQVCDEVWRPRGVPLVQVVDPALPPLLLAGG